MGKVIKKVDFSDVHPLVNKSYEIFYNVTMRKALGVELTRLFAPMKETQTTRSWLQPNGVKGTFHSIVDAPDEISGLLAMLWEEKKTEIRSIIKGQPTVGELEKILIIPRENYIYYTEINGFENDVPDKRFRLLVTGWACEFGNPKDKGEDVATNKKVEAKNNHQNVILIMVDEDRKPMPNTHFTYTYNNACHDFNTNDSGEYHIGPCLVNTSFICEYLLTGQQRTFEVLKNISRYELQFAPFVDATVKVENQHGEPQPNIQLMASYGNQTLTDVTDGLGQTVFHDLLYQGPDVLLHLNAKTQNAESIDVRVKNESSRNNFLLRIHTQDPMSVSLLVLLDGQPAPNYSVRIDCAGNTAVYATNENGIIPLPFLNDKDVFDATSSQDEKQTQQFVVEYGTDQYTFNIQSEGEIIDPPVKVIRTLVVTNSTGKPVPLFTVRLTRDGQSVEMQTDRDGKIILPEDWTNGDKFNVEPISEIPLQDDKSTEIHVNSVSDADGNNDIVIEDGKDEYFYVLPESQQKVTPNPLARHLLVIDADKKTVPFYPLQLFYKEQLIETGTTTANKDAQIPLPEEWADGEWFEAYDPQTNTRQSYQLQPLEQEYVFMIPAHVDEQEVYVRVVNQDGAPVADYPLLTQIDDHIGNGMSDANGCVPLKNQPVEQQFTVASGYDGNIQKNYVVEKGKDEYIFPIIEDDGPVVVQLVDKNKVPVHNAQLNLTNKRKETFSHYTNQEGCIEVPMSFFTNGERINVHVVMPDMKVKGTRFKYDDKYNHYIVRLKDPFPWGCLWRLLLFLLLCLLLFVKCEKDISVIAIDGADHPLQGVAVNLTYTERQLYKDGTFFYKRTHTPTGVTGQDGRCVFEKQQCSVFSWIFYTFHRADVEGIYGKKHVMGDFLFHWRFTDYPLRFLSDATIKVISSKTGQPISGATVKLWTTDKSCDSLSLITGSDGTCSFRYVDMSAKVNRLLATHKGYSGALYQDLSLRVFTDSVFVIPLDPPSQCGTGCNNADGKQGSHAIRDFILGNGMKGHICKFDYYTDSAPDHIMVYGGSSVDYSLGKAPLIWEYDGATNTTGYTTQYSVNITLPGDVICVVVDRGTNWGYYIHCPQYINK